MSIYLTVFIEFFKIGLFSVGGGLATLPFLNNLILKYGWYTSSDLANMLAISESTPGPIGVNMSTYVGFETCGVLGALIATFGLILPSYLIIILIAHFMSKFSENKYTKSIFKAIKPTVTGLILVSLLKIYKITLFNGTLFNFLDLKAFLIFSLILYLIYKYKKHPIFYIILGGIAGIGLKL